MIFRQLFDQTSGTYCYLLASRRGGEALILDPVLEKLTAIFSWFANSTFNSSRRSTLTCTPTILLALARCATRPGA